MPLSLEVLKTLAKLSNLKTKGVIHERHFEVLEKHVTEGNSLTEGNWEAMDLTWQLREGGVFGEEAWTREIDTQILDITNSARPSRLTQQASADDATISLEL